jgi:methionyl-tRNA formyltransferase
VRIGVAATPDVAIPTLNWLSNSEHEIALVISQPDRPAGRGRELTPSPVTIWAQDRGIELLRPHSPQELVGAIDNLDVVLTIGYGVLLPEAILSLPRYGFINLHFSLLPAYRGAAPVQRAIENGESVTGVTIFSLDKGMDTGPIYTTAELAIQEEWRSLELLQALAELGPRSVNETLLAIEAGVRPIPQNGLATLAHKISKDDARIDWRLSSEKLSRKIRAFYPAPCAWSTWEENNFKITRAHVYSANIPPGEICSIDGDVIVGCGDGTALCLNSVIPAGKKEMKASEWARGARLSQGAHFD